MHIIDAALRFLSYYHKVKYGARGTVLSYTSIPLSTMPRQQVI